MPGEFEKDLVVSGTCSGRILAAPLEATTVLAMIHYSLCPKRIRPLLKMTTDEKNEISHRGNVVRELLLKYCQPGLNNLNKVKRS